MCASRGSGLEPLSTTVWPVGCESTMRPTRNIVPATEKPRRAKRAMRFLKIEGGFRAVAGPRLSSLALGLA